MLVPAVPGCLRNESYLADLVHMNFTVSGPAYILAQVFFLPGEHHHRPLDPIH